MKSKVHARSEMPAGPISVISKLALETASVAMNSEGITETQIQELAYRLYEERGRLDGNDQQDWFEAKSILRERGKLAA